jgi:hypothetical protein
MRKPLALALSAVLAATVLPAATAQFSSDPVNRGPATPNINIRNDDGSSRPGLRCGVLARTALQRDVLERNLRESRAHGLSGSLSKRPGTNAVTVPVWFHIVTKTSRQGVVTGEVSDAQIAEQLQVLDDAYAGRGFTFALAGVKRVDNSRWFDGCARYGIEVDMKASLAVDPAHNLNFYSCKPGDYLGYAYYPDSFDEHDTRHGVVVLHSSFPQGSTTNYNEGDTGTHEVGHYLGLAHTFEGGCAEPGDYVADTPPEDTPAFGCPVGRDTCPGGGPDPIFNFMDYTYDSCMNTFTAGQDARMQEITALYKPSLGL